MTADTSKDPVSGPIGNVFHDLCCEGCKHQGYVAPDGQTGYPGADPRLTLPHARCHYFRAYIPAVKSHGRVVNLLACSDFMPSCRREVCHLCLQPANAHPTDCDRRYWAEWLVFHVLLELT
jgi:hypothetical protein